MDTNLERDRAAVAEDDTERVTSAPAPGSRDAGVSMTICWPVLRAGDDRKTIKSREGAAMRARCVFWRDSEVGGGRKVEQKFCPFARRHWPTIQQINRGSRHFWLLLTKKKAPHLNCVCHARGVDKEKTGGRA